MGACRIVLGAKGMTVCTAVRIVIISLMAAGLRGEEDAADPTGTLRAFMDLDTVAD